MFKKFLSLIFICLMLLSAVGCQGEEKYFSVKTDVMKKYNAIGNKGEFSFNNSKELEIVAENDYLILCYDKETMVITVFDKRNGKEYTTNHISEDFNKNNSKLAALNLIYSNTQGKSGSIDSYTQSVALGQVDVVKNGNKVTFNYNIGDISDGLEVTPSVMSNERFNQFFERADEQQQKLLKRRYSYIKENDNWTRRKIVSPVAINDLVNLFKDLGYTNDDLIKDNAENNVEDVLEDKLSFFVPLTFALEDDSVVASIDMEKITCPQSNPLTKIEVLQFFGAVKGEQDGYFLLPDGSGAIMPFAVVENGSAYYAAPVYGYDNAMRKKVVATKSKDVLMPIYGVSYKEGGFLSVIEDGEALADIYAYNSGASDDYNKIFSTLNYLKTESVSLGDQGASENYNYYNFQKQSYKGNYSVRYIFLESEKNDYSQMACVYRKYLINSGELLKSQTSDKAPFVLETVGGILTEKQFLGVKYRGISALTEYKDNIAMLETLSKGGIANIKLKLSAFWGDGLQNIVPVNIKLITSLGGREEFNKLLSSAKESNVMVYPDFKMLTFSANSGILAKNKYAVKSMDFKDASIEIINQATLEKNEQIMDNLYYLTSVKSLPRIAEKIQFFLNKYDIKAISIADMASGISSDFSTDSYYDRQSAINTASSIIKDFSNDYEMMLNAANVKNSKCADIITEAPLWSSQYKYSEGVPFYSMVYHGSVDYTGESINLSSDITTEFLRCIEYGASLKFTMIYRNNSLIKDSDYTKLYSVEFADNYDKALNYYKSVNELYCKTKDSEIVMHNKICDMVFLTEYANGVKTIVNYSDKDYLSDYGTVPAQNYILIG